MLRAVVYFAAALLAACAPGAQPETAARAPHRAPRHNVLLSFASDWECVISTRAACQRAIAEHLRGMFADYDVGFWPAPSRERVDGITLFFETSDPREWGGGARTVGYSPERCAPEVVDGTILGAAAIFHCGDRADHGPSFCAGASAHEVGHLLGLEHVVEPASDLMNRYFREGNAFGRAEAATENLCRGVQDDSTMLLAALGAARDRE